MMEVDEITCPHCGGQIEIMQLNCGIFRHGQFKHNKIQVPPHATQLQVQSWLNQNLIQGCGQPFLVDQNLNVRKCGWI